MLINFAAWLLSAASAIATDSSNQPLGGKFTITKDGNILFSNFLVPPKLYKDIPDFIAPWVTVTFGEESIMVQLPSGTKIALVYSQPAMKQLYKLVHWDINIIQRYLATFISGADMQRQAAALVMARNTFLDMAPSSAEWLPSSFPVKRESTKQLSETEISELRTTEYLQAADAFMDVAVAGLSDDQITKGKEVLKSMHAQEIINALCKDGEALAALSTKHLLTDEEKADMAVQYRDAYVAGLAKDLEGETLNSRTYPHQRSSLDDGGSLDTDMEGDEVNIALSDIPGFGRPPSLERAVGKSVKITKTNSDCNDPIVSTPLVSLNDNGLWVLTNSGDNAEGLVENGRLASIKEKADPSLEGGTLPHPFKLTDL